MRDFESECASPAIGGVEIPTSKLHVQTLMVLFALIFMESNKHVSKGRSLVWRIFARRCDHEALSICYSTFLSQCLVLFSCRIFTDQVCLRVILP